MIKNAYYPCEDCECIPAFCGVDIDICQLTCGESRPQSSEEYEVQKEERYKVIECDVECKKRQIIARFKD